MMRRAEKPRDAGDGEGEEGGGGVEKVLESLVRDAEAGGGGVLRRAEKPRDAGDGVGGGWRRCRSPLLGMLRQEGPRGDEGGREAS